MKLSGAAAAADPDRARDYDKSYASHFQDMDRGQDQSQQVCLHMFTYDLYICFMFLSSPEAIQQRFRFLVRSFIYSRMTPGYRLDWVPWTTSAEAGLRSLTHQIPCSTCSGLRRLRISRGLRIPSEEEEDRVKLPDHLQGTTRTVLAPVPQKKNRSKADSAEGVVDQLRIPSSCRNDP